MSETKRPNSYLIVVLLILVIIFFSSIFSKKGPSPDGKQLIAAPGQGEAQPCDPPMQIIDGECIDPGPGGGGGDNVAAPTVTTSAATGVDEDSATLNGNISDTGGADATTRGFHYGTTLSYGSDAEESGTFSTGDFSSTLSDLECDTDYYFQAYATNSGDTGTGSAQTFTTDSCSNPTDDNENNPQVESGNSGNNQDQTPDTSNTNTGGGSGYVGTSISAPVASPTAVTATNETSAPSAGNTETQSVLSQLLTTIAENQPAPTVPPPDLFLGNYGSYVYDLQVLLNRFGFPLATGGPGSPSQETLTFGPLTEASLKLFQQAHSLPVTGYFGHVTWEVMMKLAGTR